ncbi:MAG: hypothetical protein KF729_09680 [Sandaracinaceae bacterium]|nr:hypothetical protein [Sandaracinaceae bacterium]
MGSSSLSAARVRGLAVAGCLFVLAGCEAAEVAPPGALPSDSSNHPPNDARVAAPADLGEAIERARATFFEADGLYVAGLETHRVALRPDDDAIAVTPIHHLGRDARRATLVRVPGDGPLVSTGAPRREAAQPFVARTRSIERGGERLDAPPARVEAERGQLAIARGAILERIENRADGVEQRWHFERRPEGQGALIVRVAVEGMRHRGASATGEHFEDPATGLGVRYGHGTFIDARGRETHVPVHFDGGALVLEVAADVVDAAAYPAVLDPIIGPEITIDAPVTGPRGGNQVQPRLASDGSGFLLVFVDGLFGDDDLRGARISAAGALLDALSFRIAAPPGSSNQNAPAVSHDGTSYVVVWQDGRNEVDWDLYGARVSSAGVVTPLDGTPIAVTPGVNELAPAVASASGTTLVAYRSGDTTTDDVVGRRLDGTLTPTDATPFVIGGGPGLQARPTAVASTSGFLVTYSDTPPSSNTAVRGRRVNAAGAALADAAPFLIDTVGFSGGLAWDGGATYLATWTGFAGGFLDVRVAAVPVSGAVGAVTGTVVSPGAAGRDYQDSWVAYNGAEYLVTYLDALYDAGGTMILAATLGAARVAPALTVSGRPVLTSIVGTTAQPTVTALGSTFLCAYVDFTGEHTEVRGTRVTSGTVLAPAGTLFTSGPNDQTAPVVASSGTSILVAWLDFRGGQVDVWGALLGADGTVGGAAFPLTSGPGAEGPVDAAWSGSRYVVVIEEDDHVRGVTVTPAGVASTPFDIAASALGEVQPSIACSAGVQCLVAWTEVDRAAASPQTEVRARRLDATGAVPTLGATGTVVAAAGDQFQPAVGASSTGFYVAWTDGRVSTNLDVRGTRYLNAALDAAGGVVLGGAAGTQAQPRVASDGTGFLVVFADERAGGATPADVYAQRVGAGGALVGVNQLVAGEPAASELQPTVAFNGRYLVAWTRVDGANAFLQAARIDADGTRRDTTPLLVTPTTALVDSPRLAASAPGEWAIAYRLFESGNARIRARVIRDDLPNGRMCSAASECASGFCADGVCCNAACTGACDACSVAAGAATDGMCAPIPGCGGTDAGTMMGTDAGAMMGTDAGTMMDPDAGTMMDPDAGAGDEDAGVETDAGTGDEDAGPMETDAGSMETDAGVTPGTDAGVVPGADAGMIGTDAGGGVMPPTDGGCGCSTPGEPRGRGLGALLVLGVGALVGRRRARRARQ